MQSRPKPIKIAIVAGEISGDILGAGLIRALKEQHPNVEFEGIPGPQMLSAGCESLFPMDAIAAGGLVEILGRLPQILSIRRQLKHQFLQNPPDLYIGIDAPDFNLPVEKALRAAGIKTLHYVSPTVWAWRQGRIKGIAKSVDKMLTLFPFENDIYHQHKIPVTCVGHPMADEVPLVSDKGIARRALGLEEGRPLLALLPGSRALEVKYLTPLFLQAASRCRESLPNLRCVIPCASPARREDIQQIINRLKITVPITLVDGRAREVMAAADVVLLSSGTATLECALVKRPMVVAYQVTWITYWILRCLVTVNHIALPNLLAGKELVPEFIQGDAKPSQLAQAVLERFKDPKYEVELREAFTSIHQSLRKDGSKVAAQAVWELLQKIV